MFIFAANVVESGKKEIIEYLKSIGGASPILNGDSWDPSQFNLSKIVQHEPYYGVLYLLDYEFKPWSNLEAWNKTHSIPALIKEGIFYIEDPERLTYSHYKEMLVEMFELQKHNSSYKEKYETKIDTAVDNLKKFGEVRKCLYVYTKERKKYISNIPDVY